MLKKFKAFMIANIILALVATSVFAFSLMVTVPSMFGSLDAERVAAQAMQYAEVEANIVKLLNYDDLDDTSVLTSSNLHTTRQTLDAIDVSGWEDQITIGDENVMGDGENKYRIAQIDIYKTGDTVPRASLNVPLTSQANSSGGEAVGTIIPRLTDVFASEREKECYLYCDGSSFSSTAYPKLYAVLGVNVLPDIRNRVLQGSDLGFQTIEAGLPNITGRLDFSARHNVGSRGAFSMSYSSTTGYWNSSDSILYIYANFDASRSNPIYGASTTVQPPAVTVRYYIRAK